MVTSVSGNSSGQSILTALGAGGGLDATNLATSLVTAEKVPQQTLIDKKRTASSSTISSVGKVKSALTTLQSTLAAIGDVKSFQTTPVSADPSKLTVAFKPGSSPPSFNNYVDVQQVATATSVLFPPLGSTESSLVGVSSADRTLNLVSGKVQNSVINGTTMTLPQSSETGAVIINGVSIAVTLGTSSNASNRTALVDAINAQSSVTGVTAINNSDDNLGITLTAADGRSVTTSLSNLTAEGTGIAVGSFGATATGATMSGRAMIAPTILSPATTAVGAVTINGVTVNLTLGSDVTSNRATVIAAINAQSKSTGVTAVDTGSNGSGINLASATGKAISVSFPSVIGSSAYPSTNGLTGANTGLSDGAVNAKATQAGSAMTAPSSAKSGTVTVNGIEIAVTLGTDKAANRTAILAAINARTGDTGVKAVDTGSDTTGVTLETADGRAIKVSLSSTITAGDTGLKPNVLKTIAMKSTDTLTTLRDQINQISGMTATILQGGTDAKPLYYLSIKSGTGEANDFYADITAPGSTVPLNGANPNDLSPDSDGLLGNYYSSVTAGQDAKISIDGVAITSSTNVFDKAIPGVILTAVAPSAYGSTVNIHSETNKDALTTAITSLVAGFNQVMNTMAGEMSYNSNDNTKSGGLANNPIARTLLEQLRSFTTQEIQGYDEKPHFLADIGVKTNRNGTLTLDTNAFNLALTNSPDVVAAVLASKQSVSDSRLAPGQIDATAKAGVYTIKKEANLPTVTTVQANNGNPAKAAVVFKDLSAGGFVKVGGLTFTATASMTATEVAQAFVGLTSGSTSGPAVGKGSYSGTLGDFATGAVSGQTITFSQGSTGDVTNLGVDTTVGWTINGQAATLIGSSLKANSGTTAEGISVYIPNDLAGAVASGFTTTLNYSKGIIERFNAMIDNATGNTSSLQGLTDDENKKLTELDTKQTTLDDRMAALQTRYIQQFSRLQALLTQAKSTQSSLTDFQTAWSNSLKSN